MSDKKRCGICEHFDRKQGMFGRCRKTGEVAFAGDATCGEFREKKVCTPSGQTLAKFGQPAIMNPFDPFMGLFSGAFMSTPMKNSGSDYAKKEDTWENPIFRRKRPAKKVIDFKEAGDKIRKRKKLTKGGL